MITSIETVASPVLSTCLAVETVHTKNMSFRNEIFQKWYSMNVTWAAPNKGIYKNFFSFNLKQYFSHYLQMLDYELEKNVSESFYKSMHTTMYKYVKF